MRSDNVDARPSAVYAALHQRVIHDVAVDFTMDFKSGKPICRTQAVRSECNATVDPR